MLTRRKLLQTSCAGLSAISANALRGAGALAQSGVSPSSGNAVHFGAGSPVQAVAERLLGERADDFRLEWMPPQGERQVYEVAASGGRAAVKGSSGVAALRGLYSYLRETSCGMFTWSGRRLALPAVLPDRDPRRVVCPFRFVQYLNPCTFGYSAAFWDWDRWEREIDWMALHGVNMPLALEGQEAIWQRVWASFGITGREWNQFTTGPAHLPWHRMGNINQFQGPLPQSWIDQKRQLQKQILDRMLALEMTPIVPAFAGHVPEAFLRIHPGVRVSTLLWGGASSPGLPRETRTFLLHPAETALYKEIGRRFITEYKAEFRAGEYYLADSFNELAVPAGGGQQDEQLKRFARNIYGGIQAGDPDGKWVMQGWIFANDPKFWDRKATAAFLSGVPNDRLFVIDYACDLDALHEFDYHDAPDAWKRLDAFSGKQWIAGMAHTFGGNNNVKGDLALIASKTQAVRQDPRRGNLVGWGMNMEGIESNEVVYELMTDLAWTPQTIDLAQWIPGYCKARYGTYPAAMAEAWKLLLGSAYRSNAWKTKHAFQARPSLNPRPQFVETGSVFREAVHRFLSCAGELESAPLYRNDLIELVAQAAGGTIDHFLAQACHEHTAGHSERRDREAGRAFELMARVDALFNIREDRRLERWVAAARHWSHSPDEADYYDRNSRTLITFWGWKELEDYAARLYSGLIRDYYLPRWKTFFASLGGLPPAVEEWELEWLSRPYVPSQPRQVPDLMTEARSLFEECCDILQ